MREIGNQEPLWVQNQRNSWHGVDFPHHMDRPFTDILRDYYRTLSAVDDSLASVSADATVGQPYLISATMLGATG